MLLRGRSCGGIRRFHNGSQTPHTKVPALPRSKQAYGTLLRPLWSAPGQVVIRSHRSSAVSLELSPTLARAIRRKLLRWYDDHKRDLPWRSRSTDAYAQWVAEVMLQQTQVDTVIPYYERFLKRFPTVETLAAASLDDVLTLWQGLGYYRRAVNLHRGAGYVVRIGGMPRSSTCLQEIPGIGRYTAGAIASIAYGERVAAVDGNVARVLSRLFYIDSPVSDRDTQKRLWTTADHLRPRQRCGDFNQAWMDLGSAICTPNAPRCDLCPLIRECVGFQAGVAASLPVKTAKKTVPETHHVVAVVKSRGAYLITKRPTGGLWGGLWEFPNRSCPVESGAKTVLNSLLDCLGFDGATQPRRAGVLSHRLTHRLMHFETFVIQPSRRNGVGLDGDYSWAKTIELNERALSTASRKIFALANKLTHTQS